MKKLDDKQIKKIIDQYKNGLGSDTIAKNFMVTPTCILKILKKNNIPRRDFTRKLGDKHQEIISLYESGLSTPEIAEKLNVSHAAILKILKKNKIQRRSAEECHRIYEINEDFFDKIDTEEKAYFLGFLYADGYNSKNNKTITLNLNIQDKEILIKFAKLIYKDNYTESHIHIYDRQKENKGISAVLNIHSKYMCQKLSELGCINAKTFKITFPKWLEPSLQRHFIRGYFDGDGSVSVIATKKRGSTIKITSTLAFATSIKNILENILNVHMCIYKAKYSDVYDVYTSGDRQIEKILNWFYTDATIYLKRKHNKYIELLNNIEDTNKFIIAGTQGYKKSILTKQKSLQ